jgi:hypothetical protein
MKRPEDTGPSSTVGERWEERVHILLSRLPGGQQSKLNGITPRVNVHLFGCEELTASFMSIDRFPQSG